MPRVKGQKAYISIAARQVLALDKVEERETKAFIIRQLQIVGQDDAVEALSAYLGNPELK